MKALAVSFLFSLFSVISIGQDLKPVSWDFKVNQNEDKSYVLVATAKMKGDWAIYSQHTGEGGPVALTFTYDDGVALTGETKETSDAIKTMSDLFEVEVIKFKKEAIFKQNFILKSGQTSIKGTLNFMCCDNLRCLPPTDVVFDVAI